ncbi:MAG: hypothetical protein RL385_5414 [Pseudomonadota bacterium]
MGTAVRTDDGFRLSMGELSIGALPDAPSASMRRVPPPAGGDGAVFPPYGQSRGAPVAGASLRDLEFYANGCRRTLADPAKSRWHDKERVLLAAIEAELARQSGGQASGAGGSGRSTSFPPASDHDGAPDYTDDDIPF